jgi:rRNA maturation endonuclease Nob1
MSGYRYVTRTPRTVPAPRAQTSTCAGCGVSITETERRPCERCGSINRHVSATATDRLAITDKA